MWVSTTVNFENLNLNANASVYKIWSIIVWASTDLENSSLTKWLAKSFEIISFYISAEVRWNSSKMDTSRDDICGWVWFSQQKALSLSLVNGKVNFYLKDQHFID